MIKYKNKPDLSYFLSCILVQCMRGFTMVWLYTYTRWRQTPMTKYAPEMTFTVQWHYCISQYMYENSNFILLLCVPQVWPPGIQCQICHMTFSDQSAINAHYDTAHSNTTITRARPGEGTHACDVCGKKFTQKSSLNKHVSTVHSDVKNFECDVCSQTFTQKSSLKRHLNTVHKMSAWWL